MSSQQTAHGSVIRARPRALSVDHIGHCKVYYPDKLTNSERVVYLVRKSRPAQSAKTMRMPSSTRSTATSSPRRRRERRATCASSQLLLDSGHALDDHARALRRTCMRSGSNMVLSLRTSRRRRAIRRWTRNSRVISTNSPLCFLLFGWQDVRMSSYLLCCLHLLLGSI